jgi:hypothetical protein
MRLFILACIIFLSGCGGGGGEGDQVVVTPIIQEISTSSYQNVKNFNYHINSMPTANGRIVTGFAQVFYKDNDQVMLFQPNIAYDVTKDTLETAAPSEFNFYRLSSGNWQQVYPKIVEQDSKCLHPRKAITADFNNDKKIDIVIACHGYDKSPFLGEYSLILESRPDGSYLQRRTHNQKRFFHSVTAGDLNGDGSSDLIFSINDNGVEVLINDGKAGFYADPKYQITGIKQAFTVELIDVSDDGLLDLVVGGHDWTDPTRVLLNPGQGIFNLTNSIIVPPVPNAGVILDFVHQGRDLFVLRTGDGQLSNSEFYRGLWIQKFNTSTQTSTLLIADPNWKDPRLSFDEYWLRWFRIFEGRLLSYWGYAIDFSLSK